MRGLQKIIRQVCRCSLMGFAGSAIALPAAAQSEAVQPTAPQAYYSINPTMTDRTVTLTGEDLTIEQVIEVARYGAKVLYAPGSMQRAQQAADLRAEAAAENILFYGQHGIGPGDLVEVNKNLKPADRVPQFPVLPISGAGDLPEISQEDLVRADLVIGANTSILGASDPAAMQMIIDLLNDRITPVAYSIGTLGEADFPAVSNNIQATLSGHGYVYYQGVRMPASQALASAGLKPLSERHLFAGAENAYGDARAALLVADGRRALEWADLIYALDKLGMDSSVTPMLAAVQARRPFPWVNWDAARIMDMLGGSYLFQAETSRTLQDPESMRARYIRAGSAWQAWAALRDAVQLQINSADLNPMVLVGASPSDSEELAMPYMRQFYVKGGPLSHGQHGYVFSTANWDPYPMANQEEAFTNALANMDVAVAQTLERFTIRLHTPFFTDILPPDVLTPDQFTKSPALSEPFWVFMDLWQEIQSLSPSIVPEGSATDLGVADIEAQTRLKGTRGLQVVDLTMKLLGYDLWNATYWLDLRKAQNSARTFGPVATRVWQAFRKILPWQEDPQNRPEVPFGIMAYEFLESTSASTFYPGGPAMPSQAPVPSH